MAAGAAVVLSFTVALAMVLLLTATGMISADVMSPLSVSGTLQLDNVATPIPAYFTGTNVVGHHTLPAGSATLLAQTTVNAIRFPGGAEGDTDDLSANLRYSPSGGSSAMSTSAATFAQLCEAVSCRAIIQLPMEIDNPSQDAAEARYVVSTLGLQPYMWELGNEPHSYSCWGVPWARWSSSTCTTSPPTPQQYAAEAAAVISAVRGVDPGARFMAGMGGRGYCISCTGSADWVTPLFQANGASISALSIHVYPDGAGPTLPSLDSFFSGLAGSSSLADQVATAEQAVARACPGCGTQVWVTEMGSTEAGGSNQQYVGTYYDAIFHAGEVVEGLAFHAGSLESFAWNGGSYPVAGTPLYTLYSDVVPLLGTSAVNATVLGTAGVYAAVTQGGGKSQLLLVNANTASADISLATSGFPTNGSEELYSWTPTDAAPVASSANGLSSVTVPATSLAVLVAGGSTNSTTNVTSTPPPAVGGTALGFTWGDFAVLASAAVGVLFVVAIPGSWKVAGAAMFFGLAGVAAAAPYVAHIAGA